MQMLQTFLKCYEKVLSSLFQRVIAVYMPCKLRGATFKILSHAK
jgi:hypothetical protein